MRCFLYLGGKLELGVFAVKKILHMKLKVKNAYSTSFLFEIQIANSTGSFLFPSTNNQQWMDDEGKARTKSFDGFATRYRYITTP
jgi:hypothetical protein